MSDYFFTHDQDLYETDYRQSRSFGSYDEILLFIQNLAGELREISDLTSLMGSKFDSKQNRDDLTRLRNQVKQNYMRIATKLKIFKENQKAIENFSMKNEKLEKEFKKYTEKYKKILTKSIEKQKKVVLEEKQETERLEEEKQKKKKIKRHRPEDEDEEEQRRINEEKKHLLKKEQQMDLADKIEKNVIKIKKREQDIYSIETEIKQIVEITKELQWNAHKQEETVGLIEDHIDNSYENTKQGTNELRKSNKMSKHGRTIACVIILLFLVIAVVLAVAFFIVAKFTFL